MTRMWAQGVPGGRIANDLMASPPQDRTHDDCADDRRDYCGDARSGTASERSQCSNQAKETRSSYGQHQISSQGDHAQDCSKRC